MLVAYNHRHMVFCSAALFTFSMLSCDLAIWLFQSSVCIQMRKEKVILGCCVRDLMLTTPFVRRTNLYINFFHSHTL